MKKLIVIAAMITAFGLGGAAAFAASSDKPDEPKKVFVCKYVGTPGVDERLQTGQNPISVSINAIPDGAAPGAYFADAHGRSYVLAFDTGQPEPDVSACPGGDTPTTPVDVCPNIEGDQETVPDGLVIDGQGDCVEEETPTEPTETEPTETTPTETTPTTPTDTTPTETTPTTSAQTTATETTSTETTPSETTVADPASPEDEQQVFTPPAQQTKAAQSQPASQVEANMPVARPTKAAQPAPLTP